MNLSPLAPEVHLDDSAEYENPISFNQFRLLGAVNVSYRGA